MQFPESWLREYCNPPLNTQELADTLTMAGLEVEELRPVAPPFTRVVVGAVLSATPHPNADRLRVCEVDAGTGSVLSIVCGAPNVRAGLRVPCALVGAELPPGEDGRPFVIKVGKLRGIESQGMLCSARELKLSDDHGGLLELDDEAPVGADVRSVLRLDDTLFTLKLTPNLAHCLSIHGVAREVAALTGAPLRVPEVPEVPVTHDDVLPVRVEAPDLCGRFSGRIVRGVDVRARTPVWMVERLMRCGQRPVSPLVDISNYVMFELGQPSHIFDLGKIHDGLVVRWGRPGERLELLNGQIVEVDAGVGVIADSAQVESLAGIMGGETTAVSDDTRDIYVEAAFWWPQAVAGRSRRYNFSTDAGHRFERGVDPARTVDRIQRITELILQICGGQAGPMDDHVLRLPERKPVTLRVARAAKVIGMPVDQVTCADVLRRLGLDVQESPGQLSATPPSWRFDLTIEEDLIEEVARLVGYDRLPDTPPLAPVSARVEPENHRSAHALRLMVAGLDYQETINYSFVEAAWERDFAGNHDPVQVLNPIASPLSVMRSTLIGSLVQVLRFNLARKAQRVRVFELGRVYRRDATVPDGDTTVAGLDQPMRVAALAFGSADSLQWGSQERQVDFFDAKGDVQALLAPVSARFVADQHPAMHPGRCARVEVNGEVVGHVGELHPRWRQAYELPAAPVLFELDFAALARRPVPHFVTISRQQSALRDIAVIISDQLAHDAVMDVVQSAPTQGLLRRAQLFDIYKPKAASAEIGAGEHSVAIRLELLDEQATLTEGRIDDAVQAIRTALSERLAARLRG